MKKSIRARGLAPAFSVSVLSLACGAAWAQSVSEVNPVVVTATRMEQPLSQTLSSVSVITREDIDKAQVSTLADLLQGEAGVEFGRNGGPGTTTSFFLRGQESTNVMVMVDGVRAQTDGYGNLTMTDMPLAQIDHIEILRGNASALYGEAAIGGVISIFTRSGQGSTKPYGSISYGSHNTAEANVGYSGAADGYKFDLNAGGTSSNGISAMNPAQNSNANPSNDPYSRQFASVKVDRAIDQGLSVGVRATSNNSSTYYDTNSDMPTDTHQFKIESNLVGAYVKKNINQSWNSQLDISSSDLTYSDYKNGSLSSLNGESKGHQDALRWFNTYQLPTETVLNFGVDQIKERYTNSTTSGYGADRETLAYFGGVTQILGRLTMQANMRHDDIKVSGQVVGQGGVDSENKATTGLLGLGYQITEAIKWTVNGSTGFRAPAENDLAPLYGNPLLKPEFHNSKETGFTYSENNSLIRLVYFESHSTNSIAYDQNTGVPYNIGELDNHGIELTAKTIWMGNSIKASYVNQNPWDVTDNMQALRRARSYGSLDVARRISEFQLGAKFYASSSRNDSYYAPNAFTPTYLTDAGYSTVSLYGSKKIDDEWTARLKFDNIFNRQYQLAYGYNTLGRGLYLTFQYQPK